MQVVTEVIISLEWAEVEKTTKMITTMSGFSKTWASGSVMEATDGTYVWEIPKIRNPHGLAEQNPSTKMPVGWVGKLSTSLAISAVFVLKGKSDQDIVAA